MFDLNGNHEVHEVLKRNLFFSEVIVNQLTTLQNRVGHVQSLTSAVSDRFGQLVANHRRFLMLTQMCGGNQESSSQPLRERLEDLVNNKVDAEKAVSADMCIANFINL